MIEKLPSIPVFDGCFICGANHASWLLNSKPTHKAPNQPHFPFLRYQLQASTTKKIDCNGEYFVCNVCYFFLMQQWDSYEDNGTPLVKRLYWIKKSSDRCNLENLHNKYQVDNLTKNIKIEEKQKQQHQITRQVDSSQKKNPQNYETFFTCYLCSYQNEEQLSSIVYTVPQESPEVPFFNGIVREDDKNAVQKDGNKVLLCKECSLKLHEQWVEYHTNCVPVSERKYYLIEPTDRNNLKRVTCSLCHDQLSNENKELLYCKKASGNPYYPFLMNLSSEANTMSAGGFTFSCLGCKDFLFMQWNVFQKMAVPQEERVYRISLSQVPFLPTIVDREIQCLLCRTVNPGSKMKRVYCNPGANLHPGVDLKAISQSIKELGFYDENTGESFVCLSCFMILKNDWQQRCADLFAEGQQDFENSNIQYPQCCRICLKESIKLVDVYFKKQQDDSMPYFPSLVDLSDKNLEHTSIKACKFCQAALLSLWNRHYTHEEIINKVVHLDLFCCSQCERLVKKSTIAGPDFEDRIELLCKSCSGYSKVCFLYLSVW